jgi:hypothetical protein
MFRDKRRLPLTDAFHETLLPPRCGLLARALRHLNKGASQGAAPGYFRALAGSSAPPLKRQADFSGHRGRGDFAMSHKTNALIITVGLTLSLSLPSCVSSPEPPSGRGGAGSGLQGVANEIKSLKLAKGEVWQRDLSQSKEVWESNAFSAASDMLALDEWFDFRGTLSDEEIIGLARALFKGLPKRESPGDLRAAAIGGIYPDGSPLIVIITQFDLKPGLVSGRKAGLMYLTNSAKFRSQDKNTKEVALISLGTAFNPETNLARYAVPMEDGAFVLSGDLNLGKVVSADLKDEVARANAMDTFVKDEIAANDGEIAALRDGIKANPSIDPVVSILADMNWALYLLKTGKAAEAESLWNSLKSALPENADPSIGEALREDPGFLMNIWKAWPE